MNLEEEIFKLTQEIKNQNSIRNSIKIQVNSSFGTGDFDVESTMLLISFRQDIEKDIKEMVKKKKGLTARLERQKELNQILK